MKADRVLGVVVRVAALLVADVVGAAIQGLADGIREERLSRRSRRRTKPKRHP